MADLYQLLKYGLFQMDAENAHNLAVRTLAGLDRLLPRGNPAAGELPVEVAGLRFPNPVGLAAGFDKNGVATRALAALGFGFLEVGTVTPLPQPGNPRPRIFRVPERRAVINRLGFNSLGAEAAERNLRRRTARVPIGVNVGPNRGTPPEELVEKISAVVGRLAPFSDYLVLNLSSPNTPGLRDLLAPTYLATTLSELKERIAALGVTRPLFLKVSPDTNDEGLEQIAQTARAVGISGLIASNTTVSREAVGEQWKDVAGGLSGEPLRERAEQVLRVLRRATGGALPLIGVGGIASAEDAFRRIRAGASLVQVYTGLVYEGPGLIRRIVTGLRSELSQARFASVAAAIGQDVP
jgi:dihydroorotate dehydrogenase